MGNSPGSFKSQDFQVFVYGTLMPGQSGYQQFCAGQVIQTRRAIAPGQLYDLPAGYPAMTSGPGWVQGYVLAFANPQILVQLDDYEDYDPGRGKADNLYYRQQLEVFSRDRTSLGLAWVYLMRSQFVQVMGGKYLPSGRWR
ncbi:MAG: gamma-glutamylcyclotransferase [Aphanocapsa sp. GSE-SYN-MK-11-07L]|nr:gamma-glutamylcyclotransferase [Aphanocapsa sp. GSE-SYN-MK-11-07L]